MLVLWFSSENGIDVNAVCKKTEEGARLMDGRFDHCDLAANEVTYR